MSNFKLTEDSLTEMSAIRERRNAIIKQLEKLDARFVNALCATLIALKNDYCWNDFLNDPELEQFIKE